MDSSSTQPNQFQFLFEVPGKGIADGQFLFTEPQKTKVLIDGGDFAVAYNEGSMNHAKVCGRQNGKNTLQAHFGFDDPLCGVDGEVIRFFWRFPDPIDGLRGYGQPLTS